MTNRNLLELPFVFSVEKLLEDLKCVREDEWIEHPNKKTYDGSWLVTSLTSTTGETKEIIAFENQNYLETPLLKRTKYIKSVIDTFKTKIEAVRFMRLGANSKIKEHRDRGSSFEEGHIRIHIPITSNDRVEFNLNGENKKLKVGKSYYINAHKRHSVINGGDNDRIHLLIDCQINDWLEEIFIKGGFKKPVYKYGSKNISDENVDDVIDSLKLINSKASLKLAKELEIKKLKLEM